MKKLALTLAAVLLLLGAATALAADSDWSIFRVINPGAFEEEAPSAETQALLDSLDEAALSADIPVQIVADKWASSYALGLEVEAARKAALGSYALFYQLGVDMTDALIRAAREPMDAAGEYWFNPLSEHSIEMSFTATFSEDQSESSLASGYSMIASLMSDGSSSFEKPEANHYVGTMEDHWYDDDWEPHPSVLTQDCTFDPDTRVMTYLQIEYVTDLDMEIREFYSVAALGGDMYEITTDTEYFSATYRDGVLGDFYYHSQGKTPDVYLYELRRTNGELTVFIDGEQVGG